MILARTTDALPLTPPRPATLTDSTEPPLTSPPAFLKYVGPTPG